MGLITNLTFLYYIAFTLSAILGVAWHPFFFSFLLLDVCLKSDTLKNSVRAIWDPRKQLLLTLALFLMMGYGFAMAGYILFADKFIIDEDPEDICCNTMLRCIICIIDTTFKQDAGIGSFLYSNNQQDPSSFNYPLFIYENLVLVFMVIILLELISGIIIDTFGALRDQDTSRQRDVEGSCFVCGLSIDAFEKGGCVDFKTHIKK